MTRLHDVSRRLALVVAMVATLGAAGLAGTIPASAESPGARIGDWVYVNDSPLASTTPPANTRSDAQQGSPGPRTTSRLSLAQIAASLATKGVRPTVSDPRLGRALADDYRGGPNPIGDGSALDAARHTVKTGDLVGGSTHLEKVIDMRNRYGRFLRRGALSQADEGVARSRYNAYRDFAQEHDLDAMMKARGLR